MEVLGWPQRQGLPDSARVYSERARSHAHLSGLKDGERGAIQVSSGIVAVKRSMDKQDQVSSYKGVDAGLLVASGPSVAVGLEPLAVGVSLPVRVGIGQQVHYPAKLLGGELVGKLCRDPIPVGGESPAGFADSAVLLGLRDLDLGPVCVRVVHPFPGRGLAYTPAMVWVGLLGVDHPVSPLFAGSAQAAPAGHLSGGHCGLAVHGRILRDGDHGHVSPPARAAPPERPGWHGRGPGDRPTMMRTPGP